MKKLMQIILMIDILGCIIAFIALCLNNLLLALISVPFILLSLVPIFAIMQNMENIEELKEEIAILKHKDKSNSDNPPDLQEVLQKPMTELKEEARGNWECVKCNTINKKGTYSCSNCKATYSPWINPTDDSSKKKKVSKWVKF